MMPIIHKCPHGNYAAGCPHCNDEFSSKDITVIKLHQFTYWFNKKTGVVTQILKKGSVNLHETHPMITKVYAEYCRTHGIQGKPFNGHHYQKMFGRVFNIANGNEVTQKQINDLFI